MRILRRAQTWIHTCFVTDGQALTTSQRRQIQSEMESFLLSQRIVYGIHFEEARRDEGLKIVLECIPLPETMKRIERRLAEEIRDIPARRAVVKTVRIE